MSDLTPRAAVDTALNEFGEAAGVDLALDADGTVTVDFAGDVRLTLELAADADQLVVHGRVGTLPPAGGELVLARAMRRNVFAMRAAGLWLGLDPAAPDVLLCGYLPAAACSAESLSALLLAMIAEVADARLALFGPGAIDPQLQPAEAAGAILFRA